MCCNDVTGLQRLLMPLRGSGVRRFPPTIPNISFETYKQAYMALNSPRGQMSGHISQIAQLLHHQFFFGVAVDGIAADAFAGIDVAVLHRIGGVELVGESIG